MTHRSDARVARGAIATLLVGLLVGLAVLVPTTSASAHPQLKSTSPAEGAQLSSAPASIVITFDEKVTQGGLGNRILDGDGKVRPSTSRISNKGRTLTITPGKGLGKGRFMAVYNVVSVESHAVPGALAFTVATPNPSGPQVTIPTMPRVRTTLSAALPGSRTITITTPVKSGEVWWHSPFTAEPLIWQFHGNGTKATATGVLPTSGTWKFEVNLSTADSILVPKGSVTLP